MKKQPLIANLSDFKTRNKVNNDRLNLEAKKITEWLNTNKLTSNLDKSKLMMFCKPQKRVSPLPALSEVFKKILWNQITEYFNLNYLFHEAQYGFRKNHSTELEALHLTDNITQRMEKENTPIAIYLDLSKAFDTINHSILLDIVTML